MLLLYVQAFLYQCVGVSAQHLSQQETVKQALQDSVKEAGFENPMEREEPSVRLSLCRSVGMMAQAVRSASPSGAPSFPAKAELLATMMAFVKEQPSDALSRAVCLQALRACSTLRYCFLMKLPSLLPFLHNYIFKCV
ncbi:maestro heat-like repeat-containing protein family member 1 isoform X3 [Lepisosteus oculatus]|uniref:maestro heat-like repeat-containing protein family member 1 isoform X3 n=1 Tax=Lepisosteus oculatus TaxID=7918 RepID=UPI003718C43C